MSNVVRWMMERNLVLYSTDIRATYRFCHLIEYDFALNSLDHVTSQML